MAGEREGEGLRFPDGSGRALDRLLEDVAEGAVIELAPGRYAGPILLTKPVTIRGAGDLTRLGGRGEGPVVTVRVPNGGRVVLDSLLLEQGSSLMGGGVSVVEGDVHLHNLHVQHCRADHGAGGALHVVGGTVTAELVRMHDVAADRGGALWVGGAGVLTLKDAEVRKSEARLGGAIALEASAHATLEGVTIGRARATTQAGGQAIWMIGARGIAPRLVLHRVRLEDVPLGAPVVIDREHPGQLRVRGSDLPRVVLRAPGVVDDGENRWR